MAIIDYISSIPLLWCSAGPWLQLRCLLDPWTFAPLAHGTLNLGPWPHLALCPLGPTGPWPHWLLAPLALGPTGPWPRVPWPPGPLALGPWPRIPWSSLALGPSGPWSLWPLVPLALGPSGPWSLWPLAPLALGPSGPWLLALNCNV